MYIILSDWKKIYLKCAILNINCLCSSSTLIVETFQFKKLPILKLICLHRSTSTCDAFQCQFSEPLSERNCLLCLLLKTPKPNHKVSPSANTQYPVASISIHAQWNWNTFKDVIIQDLKPIAPISYTFFKLRRQCCCCPIHYAHFIFKAHYCHFWCQLLECWPN